MDVDNYSAFTITKSITVNAVGTNGSVTPFGAGITINAGATDVVHLRGIEINGRANSGSVGIQVNSVGALHIDQLHIHGFQTEAATGIVFAPSSGVAELTVVNSRIMNNGNGTTGAGIQIKPVMTGGARVTIDHVTVNDNGTGIRGDTSSSTGGINITIRNSTASGNTANGIVAIAGAPSIDIMVDSSTSAFNGLQGIRAQGGAAAIRLSSTQVTGNGTGTVAVSGGLIASFGNNYIEANTANGAALSIIPQK